MPKSGDGTFYPLSSEPERSVFILTRREAPKLICLLSSIFYLLNSVF
ncbi:MAG: hypothetical protein LBD06_05330 [Candidatus Accumulibacter sp.]|nr:hypothetical protein [Accumulibacter sp.]